MIRARPGTAAAPFLTRLQVLRHRLHAHPGVSGEEGDTASLISDFLKDKVGPPARDRVGGGYGLIYEIVGSKADEERECNRTADRRGSSLPSVLLRADMDVREENDHNSVV